jgi:hypothetical protein
MKRLSLLLSSIADHRIADETSPANAIYNHIGERRPLLRHHIYVLPAFSNRCLPVMNGLFESSACSSQNDLGKTEIVRVEHLKSSGTSGDRGRICVRDMRSLGALR